MTKKRIEAILRLCDEIRSSGVCVIHDGYVYRKEGWSRIEGYSRPTVQRMFDEGYAEMHYGKVRVLRHSVLGTPTEVEAVKHLINGDRHLVSTHLIGTIVKKGLWP